MAIRIVYGVVFLSFSFACIKFLYLILHPVFFFTSWRQEKKKSHMCWNLNFPAKTWNGLVRKYIYIYYTSFYKHVHVMGFCCICFIVCTSVIFVCQVFVVRILSMFVALVWHDYIMEIDLFGCRPTPLVQEVVSVWFVTVEFIYLC